jgi:hypothetical protein
VGDARHLQALYLLTHADIRGTSPKVWNHWKGKLLADLYYATLNQLNQGEAPAPHGIIAERQAEAMRLLRFFALSDTVHERLWKQLDTVYFLRHSAEEIAWHTRSLHYRIFNNQPVVRARPYTRKAKACRSWSIPRTSPTCSPASSASSPVPATASSMPRSTPRPTVTRWTASSCSMSRIATTTAKWLPYIEHELDQRLLLPACRPKPLLRPTLAPGQAFPDQAGSQHPRR